MKNLSNFFEQNEKIQRRILDDLHNKQNLSTVEIADKLNTYPNKIRRLAKKLDLALRNKSEAQKVALETGRNNHPTLGKTRSESTKIKISEKVSASWNKMTAQEKNRRSQMSKQMWKDMDLDKKDEIHQKAHQALRKTAKDGSKLEREILEFLLDQGYKVDFHVEQQLLNEKMHLDIFLPDLRTAVEVDGPTHFQPIWGADNLKRNKKSDSHKDGLLLNSGCCIIRVRQERNLSQKFVRDTCQKLLSVLQAIENKFPKSGFRQFVIRG